MEVSRPRTHTKTRISVLSLVFLAAAWTCRGVLAGHRVQNYTFEQALQLVQSGGDNPAACVALRDRICEAIIALRVSGPNGHVAVQSIQHESR
jgi:hypothetical protein